jgi:pyruvate/2-oxoglutarate dehydrogenase complex dihydrolipoamide acyltransferase (E2) component
MIDVIMPQMGESIVEGTLTKWLKKPGETIERDEPLFEISTDKVDTEIPSPVAGTLGEILVQEGTTVGINTVVGRINDGAGAAGRRSCCRPASGCEGRCSACGRCGPGCPDSRDRGARRDARGIRRTAVAAGPQDGA